MMALSQKEIIKLAEDAGFNQHDALTASAIATAESGGDPNAHNSKPPDDSYGLWQINMIGTLGASRRQQFGISTNDQLFDPKTNAHAAWIIYKNAGYKFNPWTTFTSGAYKKKIDTGNVGKAAAAVGDQFTGITSAINNVGQNLFKGLADVVGIIIAVVLLIGAIVLIAMQSKSGKKAVSAIGGKLPL